MGWDGIGQCGMVTGAVVKERNSFRTTNVGEEGAWCFVSDTRLALRLVKDSLFVCSAPACCLPGKCPREIALT